MAAPHEKYITLINALMRNTRSKELVWATTSIENTFTTALGRYTVQIQSVYTGREDDIAISLFSPNGDMVDRFTDVAVSEASNLPGIYEEMQALLLAARRSATGAEQVIDDIIDMLTSGREEGRS